MYWAMKGYTRSVIWGQSEAFNSAHRGSSNASRLGLSRDGIQKHKFVHRLVYEAFNGPFEQESVYNMVDHINRDRADPRLVNLRASNATLNCLNNGGKGYSFHKQSLKYDVRIYKFGKITTFGSFVTEEEAAAHAIKVKAENYALHAKHYEKLEATRVR